MNTKTWPVRSIGVAVAAFLMPLAVAGQQTQQLQQIQRMQVQAQRLHESMQQMQRVHQRAQTMEHQMVQQIERLRQYEELQVQDRDRLREQERVRDMAHALSSAAREMTQAMERARDMFSDPQAVWTPEAEREMEQLHLRLGQVVAPMEESLTIMERLRERLSAPT